MKNKNILMILLLSTFLMGCTNKDSELIQNENVQSTENATDIDKDSSTSVEDSSISDKDEEADITLIKNEYSCFDGYSVKSFSVIDDVAKGCSRASFVVDLYNDGNRVKRV